MIIRGLLVFPSLHPTNTQFTAAVAEIVMSVPTWNVPPPATVPPWGGFARTVIEAKVGLPDIAGGKEGGVAAIDGEANKHATPKMISISTSGPPVPPGRGQAESRPRSPGCRFTERTFRWREQPWGKDAVIRTFCEETLIAQARFQFFGSSRWDERRKARAAVGLNLLREISLSISDASGSV